MPNIDFILVYQSKLCRVIQIKVLYFNNIYYYGLNVNLNGFGWCFNAGPIPDDKYPNGKEYPYKANTKYDAVIKALNDILNFLKEHLDGFCREDYDIQYVKGIINHVFKFKDEYMNSNLQLTLF